MAIRPHAPMAIYYGDKPNTGEYDNGVWMDLLDIPYIQKIEEAGYYDTVIRTLWLEATGWSKVIREKFPHVRQIGLSDHPLSAHVSRLTTDKQVAYINDLQYLDGIMALTEEERQWYQTAVPSKPVIKGGLPFPFETYEARYGHLRDQPKKYIALGVGAADTDRNFISSALVFNRLRLEYPELEGVYLSLPSYLIGSTSYLAETFEGIYLHERVNMDEFYGILSQCKFVINLADRNTPGRLEGEAAFFKIPVIGSNRLELQTELYPKLAVSPFELESAVYMAKDLLDSQSLRDYLGNQAYARLKKYNYSRSRTRFKNLMEEITRREG